MIVEVMYKQEYAQREGTDNHVTVQTLVWTCMLHPPLLQPVMRCLPATLVLVLDVHHVWCNGDLLTLNLDLS